MKRVLVLGAGFGGLEIAASLSEAFGDEIDVVLIDQSDHFVFGFSKLDVMFGRTIPYGRSPLLPRYRQDRRAFCPGVDTLDRPRRRAAWRRAPVTSTVT